MRMHKNETDTSTTRFFTEISALLEQGRNKAYRSVNAIMVETYWQIGKRIVEEEQKGQTRAGYGDFLITNLSRHLSTTFGKGFSEANLRNIRQLYLVFTDYGQFATQCVANLSWTNLRQIMRLEDAKGFTYNYQQKKNWLK